MATSLINTQIDVVTWVIGDEANGGPAVREKRDGITKRRVLGVEGGELNAKASKELGVKETQGFYINKVTKNFTILMVLEQNDILNNFFFYTFYF